MCPVFPTGQLPPRANKWYINTKVKNNNAACTSVRKESRHETSPDRVIPSGLRCYYDKKDSAQMAKVPQTVHLLWLSPLYIPFRPASRFGKPEHVR